MCCTNGDLTAIYHDSECACRQHYDLFPVFHYVVYTEDHVGRLKLSRNMICHISISLYDIFIPPNIWKSKFCKYHEFIIYTNNEMLLTRLSHVLNCDWLILEYARL